MLLSIPFLVGQFQADETMGMTQMFCPQGHYSELLDSDPHVCKWCGKLAVYDNLVDAMCNSETRATHPEAVLDGMIPRGAIKSLRTQYGLSRFSYALGARETPDIHRLPVHDEISRYRCYWDTKTSLWMPLYKGVEVPAEWQMSWYK